MVTFREERKEEPYAYTWLLTAVTGPDYVDRNLDGALNDDDWGYWVKFDYGKWADSYQWRTPHSGYLQDIENNYETFSYGIKELYYLDAIETRSHKALFIKSKRKDGKGVTSRLEGGSKPREYKMVVDVCDDEYLEYSVSPVSTMKLDEVFILNKEDLNTLSLNKSTGTEYLEATTSDPHIYTYNGSESVYAFNGSDIDANSQVKVKYHNGDLVLDKYDVEVIRNVDNGLVDKSLQNIQFNTDYSLAKGTPNSIGTVEDHLRINNITFEECESYLADGTIGVNIVEDELSKYGAGNCLSDGTAGNCWLNNINFYSYDPFVNYTYGSGSCYSDALAHECDYGDNNNRLTNYIGSENVDYHHLGKLTLNSIKILGKSGADIMPSTEFAYDNNPDYYKNAFDEWQFYKSDIVGDEYTIIDLNGDGAITPEEIIFVKNNYTRKRSELSAQNVDAWSLSTITSPLGSTIDVTYESDDYSKSVINDRINLSIKDVIIDPTIGSGKVKIEFDEKGLPLNDYFSINDNIEPNVFINIPSEEKVGDIPLRLNNILINNGQEQILSFSMVSGLTTTTPPKIGHIGSYTVKNVNDVSGYIIVENNYLYNLINEATDAFLIHGYIDVADNEGVGDGLRVKTLAINNSLSSEKYETRYDYTQPGTNISSGITAYTPHKAKTVQWSNAYLEYFDEVLEQIEDLNFKRSISVEYKRAIVKWSKKYYQATKYGEILSLARDLPGPGVIYEYVTSRSYVNDVQFPGKITEHYQVFNKDMVSYNSSDITNSSSRHSREIVIENNTSSIGNLLSSQTFDDQNEPLMSTTLDYLKDDDITSVEQEILETGQGTVEQSYHQNFIYKKYDDGSTLFEEKHKAQISKRVEHVDINTGVTTTNHKTGITNVTKNLAFDFYSGQVTKSLSADGYGNYYISEATPAYQKYEGMGLAINGGDNMLTQGAASITYKVDNTVDLSPVGLVSAGAQTWSDGVEVLDATPTEQGGIYRKKSSYSWIGDGRLVLTDGLYPYEDFIRFDEWNETSVSSQWQKNGEATLYDTYSHTLEAKDINSNYASTKMDPNHRFVIASAANASYSEMAYSGAEYISGAENKEGEVDKGDGFATTARSHTGDYSLQVAYGDKGFNYRLKSEEVDLNKKYAASVWVYLPGQSETEQNINGAQLYYIANGVKHEVHPQLQKNKSKSWYLLELEIPQGNVEVEIGCQNNTARNVYFDDFRVHPLDAAMTSYVYDSFSDELTYILDANNFYTHFEYDGIGRLVRTSRELLNFDFGNGKESFRADKILNERIYNYGKNHD